MDTRHDSHRRRGVEEEAEEEVVVVREIPCSYRAADAPVAAGRHGRGDADGEGAVCHPAVDERVADQDVEDVVAVGGEATDHADPRPVEEDDTEGVAEQGVGQRCNDGEPDEATGIRVHGGTRYPMGHRPAFGPPVVRWFALQAW